MMIRLMLCFFLLFLFSPSFLHAAQKRALFVSVIENKPVLYDIKEIRKLIDYCYDARIDTLFIQVYRANLAWFDTKVGDSAPYFKALKEVGQDPLDLIIELAHKKGIKVHAWLNMLSLSKNTQAPLLKKYGPSILTVDTHQKNVLEDYLIDNQFFLEPGDLRVQKELAILVGDLVRAYPKLDGLQLDYIRYPDVKPFYGHSQHNAKRFKKAHKVKAIVEESKDWKDWKRNQVTGLVGKLKAVARKINPKIAFSTTGCVSYSRAYHEAMQDWPMWVNSGLIDFATMMSYPKDELTLSKNIADLKKHITDFSKVIVAVAAYKLVDDPEEFAKHFTLCQKSKPMGCAVFYYGSIRQNPTLGDYLVNVNYGEQY